eukprot:scaffold76728_cov36-Attheya_sp.AAC.5
MSRGVPHMPMSREVTYEGNLSGSVSYRHSHMRRIGTHHHHHHHHTTILQSDRRLHYDTMSRQSAYVGHGQNILYMESCQEMPTVSLHMWSPAWSFDLPVVRGLDGDIVVITDPPTDLERTTARYM